MKCLENFGLREIVHWIVAGFDEQEDVFASGDPSFARAYAHAPTTARRITAFWAAVLARGTGLVLPVTTDFGEDSPTTLLFCRADLSASLTTGPNYLVAPG